MPENLIAASAPQAGYFSLLVQRKVTKRKHTPEPPKTPALLAKAGALPDGTSLCRWQVRAPGSEPR